MGFGKPVLIFLCRLISKYDIQRLQEKVQGIVDFSLPETTDHGLVNVYHRFIPKCASPQISLLCCLTETDKRKTYFDDLKKALEAAAHLSHGHPTYETCLIACTPVRYSCRSSNSLEGQW